MSHDQYGVPEVTERQAKALLDTCRIAREHGVDIRDGDLRLHFQPEYRPGRGHDLIAWFWDGENQQVVEAYLDVYGNGPALVSVYGDLVHNDSNEDHLCPIHDQDLVEDLADDDGPDDDAADIVQPHRAPTGRPVHNLPALT